jgi:imidazole glycerol-phosphate synthase subunit HisF
MLTKRIIPCLDIKDGRTVKGINFEGLRDAGDPVELAAAYSAAGADELVFLDISATKENRKTLAGLVKRIAQAISVPFTIGGGISAPEDAEVLLESGADKISVNSAAVRDPELISRLAAKYGSQFVVAAVDSKHIAGTDKVFISGGALETGLETADWCRKLQYLGAGEILLTSMDRDGTQSGFDHTLLNRVNRMVSIPVIASGGAGTIHDFTRLFQETSTDAALAASVFHYGKISIQELKQHLSHEGITIRP